MKRIISVKDVIKEYGEVPNVNRVVNNVSFDIFEGEFVVLLGQSGAGKSTVLNLIGGMDSVTSGSIQVAGSELSLYNDDELADYRASKLGYIFQSYNLIPSLNVYENVNISKELVQGGFSTEEVLKLVGLQNHMNKFPSQLSGGQQQRVAIARALCKNPDIILGDEPTGALDTNTGIMVMSLLQRLCWKLNKTIIIVTHNPEYANYADRIIYMKNGKIDYHLINDSPLEVVV